jgi:transposase InsO family protein
LCQQYGITRKTGYKWIKRFEQSQSLEDQSRRPVHSPRQTDPAIVERIVALRQEHPCWGPRKLHRRLLDVGHQGVPAVSTIAQILKRQGLISVEQTLKHRPMQRFEHPEPNQLWQMDFKGDFLLGNRQRCYRLTVLDDHSRYNLLLEPCSNQQRQTVRQALERTFRDYGLPERMLIDHGSPWGTIDHGRWYHTKLTVWLMHLGISITHGRPRHPQTQGKEERFHRTLQQELLDQESLADWAHARQRFAHWRQIYNDFRPHEALALAVPSSRYRASSRQFPEHLPEVNYPDGWPVRLVNDKGQISFRGKLLRVGHAFEGIRVAVVEGPPEPVVTVYFCQFKIAQIDLRGNTGDE